MEISSRKDLQKPLITGTVLVTSLSLLFHTLIIQRLSFTLPERNYQLLELVETQKPIVVPIKIPNIQMCCLFVNIVTVVQLQRFYLNMYLHLSSAALPP